MVNGHPDALFYPVHRVWEEVDLVVTRTNHTLATETLLIQMAVSSLFSKDSGREFQKLMTRLTDGG
ncbi:hypothetical protein GOD54_23675 [Sinorhizobium medicae]|nr:hypothetical protein [Sinorhizobium medicae]